MIVKEEFLNKLRNLFGLNLYEVRIWTALLSRGVSTAGELSDIGNVPRSRAYDVLESLEKKGFVMMKLGKPIKYHAVEPKEVVERAKRYWVKNAQERVKRLEELHGTDVLEELKQLHTKGIEFVEPTDLSGAIRGRGNIYQHLEYMIRNAQKSITLVTTAKGVLRKLDSLRPEMEKLRKKGVRIRVAAPVTKENLNAIQEISKFGEVKHSNKVDARFCIVDGKELLFMLLNDDDVHPSYDVGVWVNTPYFASTVEELFNNTWKNMDDASKMTNNLK